MKLVCYDPHARRTDIADAMKAFPDVDYAAPTTLADLASALPGAEIFVSSNRAYEAEAARIVREKGDSLRWIQFTTSGLDKAIGLGLPPGCVITNAAGLRAFSVAEHALFFMLSLVRQSRMAEQGQRDNAWVRDAITPRMDNLAGKHLLVIGAGAIGQEIARKAKAFDMRVTGVSRATAPLENFEEMRTRADLPDSVAGADIIVMSANYEADTHQLMSASLIGAMKPSAFFVNIGRGGLVDEDALVEALRSGAIAGAGLDVAMMEPLPEGHALYALPNVILTPHVAGAGSQGTGAGMGKILADNLRLWLKGEKLQKIVIERTA
ncbi:MAG: D-isomer specific 2-hydroxyacid dehydrogenase NAD-binding protein [Hyphomicrobiales bacterium]|nr:D-isomer specific 2-hydroxyacid dehydrogenase NAD-binding protein [Hyphomicrobiales bacterium]